jgi:hypothetical protein
VNETAQDVEREKSQQPQTRLRANIRKPRAQFELVWLDHLACRVIYLCAFRRCMRERSASSVGVCHLFCQQSNTGL